MTGPSKKREELKVKPQKLSEKTAVIPEEADDIDDSLQMVSQ